MTPPPVTPPVTPPRPPKPPVDYHSKGYKSTHDDHHEKENYPGKNSKEYRDLHPDMYGNEHGSKGAKRKAKAKEKVGSGQGLLPDASVNSGAAASLAATMNSSGGVSPMGMARSRAGQLPGQAPPTTGLPLGGGLGSGMGGRPSISAAPGGPAAPKIPPIGIGQSTRKGMLGSPRRGSYR